MTICLVGTYREETKGDCPHELCDTDRTHHLPRVLAADEEESIFALQDSRSSSCSLRDALQDDEVVGGGGSSKMIHAEGCYGLLAALSTVTTTTNDLTVKTRAYESAYHTPISQGILLY